MPCADVVCKQPIELRCACGRRSEPRRCNRGGGGSDDAAASSADGGADDDAPAPLPCDDACAAEARKKQLADAFGIVGRDGHAPLYSSDLLHFALASPLFVRTVERSLAKVAASGDVPLGGTYQLPVMDSVRRQIVHKLCKYYGLDSESVGDEPQRRVVLQRTADARLPTRSLGQVAHPNVPAAVGLAAIHFRHLDASVRTGHLTAVLEPFAGQYRLKWLNDTDAIAIFANAAECRTALRQLQQHALFDTALFDDTCPSLYGTLSTSMPRQSAAPSAASSSPPRASSSATAGGAGGWATVAKGAPRRPVSAPTRAAASPQTVFSVLSGAADSAWDE